MLPKKGQANNKIVNYTGKDIKIKFNKKIYNCKISSATELEYINIFEKNKNIVYIYYENYIIIEIPLRKLGYNFYKLPNNKYLVWENFITKDRQINI